MYYTTGTHTYVVLYNTRCTITKTYTYIKVHKAHRHKYIHKSTPSTHTRLAGQHCSHSVRTCVATYCPETMNSERVLYPLPSVPSRSRVVKVASRGLEGLVIVIVSLGIESSGLLSAALPPILLSMIGVTTAYLRSSSYSSLKEVETELPGLSEGISGVESPDSLVVEAIFCSWRSSEYHDNIGFPPTETACMSDAELDQFLLGLLSYLGISCRLHVFWLHIGTGPDNVPDLRLMSMVNQL